MAPAAFTLACSAEVIGARRSVARWLVAERLPSAVNLHGGLRGRGRVERDVDGKSLAAEDLAGNADRFQAQAGLGTARRARTVSMGTPSCCACQMARATLPRFSLPSEISSDARHHAGGQRGRRLADGGFQVGAVAGVAGGVAQVPAVLGIVRPSEVRVDAREGNHATSSGGRAPSPLRSAQADSRSQICGRDAGRGVDQHGHAPPWSRRRSGAGCASASRIADEGARPSAPAPMRRAERRHSHSHPGERAAAAASSTQG